MKNLFILTAHSSFRENYYSYLRYTCYIFLYFLQTYHCFDYSIYLTHAQRILNLKLNQWKIVDLQ